MDKLLTQYILFSFSPDDSMAAAGPLVAGLTLQLSDKHPPLLKVYTRPDWEKIYEPSEDLARAKRMLNELESLDPTEAKETFEDLLDAAVGPLRTERSGACTQAELKELLAEELQTDISSR